MPDTDWCRLNKERKLLNTLDIQIEKKIFTSMNRFLLIVVIFLSFSDLQAQEQFSTSSKRAARALQEALKQSGIREYDAALEKIKDALKRDKKFVEAYIVRGQVYEAKNNPAKALDSYQRAIDLNSNIFPKVLYSAGLLSLEMGHYQEAQDYFNRYLDKPGTGPIFSEKARKKLRSCRFALKQLKHPVPFKPESLGESINSQYDEYWPSISADAKIMVFTRLIPREDKEEIEQKMKQMESHRRKFIESIMQKHQEDFFISRWQDTSWSEARNLGSPINTSYNEGAQSLSADGRTMYFSACNKKGGVGGCDIYYARMENGQWSKPFNLGPPVNTKDWESQPSISPDGKTLYYTSNRKDGKGKKDLWKSRKKPDGSWSKPVNLGDSINTPENEVAPFIHMDNQTLYFSSDGWPGMGNLDLFKTQKKSDTGWTKPLNLGYPINTHQDEFGMVVTAGGSKAYYSSARDKKQGKDILQFELYKTIQPVPSSYLMGKVFDRETDEPLKAKFELIALDSGKVIMESIADRNTGEFLVCIPSNNNYLLNVSKKGYLFYSDNFFLKGIHKIDEPFRKDIPLKPIKTGENMILRNVYYATDSFRLKPESRIELNKLYQLLIDNAGLEIEISGHTDSIGTRHYNLELSEKRARSVYQYLITKGIDPDRLVYKGYGERMPIATNKTETGRARNRRTEITITGK